MKKFDRMLASLPSSFNASAGTFLKGLLESWALSDDDIDVQLKNTKDQLFVNKATDDNLTVRGSDVGVARPTELGILDDDFRKLVPILSFFPKQVRGTIIALLEVFWGPQLVRANISSLTTETYNFGPEITLAGTTIFQKNHKEVVGVGTNFLSTVESGDYVKPLSLDGTAYRKVARVINDELLELSENWELKTTVGSQITTAPIRELNYIVDGVIEKAIRFIPNSFEDLSDISVKELVNFINSSEEHREHITADTFLDPIAGNKLNIRTNNTSLLGSIQITGGDANTILQFDNNPVTEAVCRVFEINPNEIVVRIPASVPVLRRTLKGSAHPRQIKKKNYSSRQFFNVLTAANTDLTVEVDGDPIVIDLSDLSFYNNPEKASALEIAQLINSQTSLLKANSGCSVDASKVVELQTFGGSSNFQVMAGGANDFLQFSTDLIEDEDLIKENYPSAYVYDPDNQQFRIQGVQSKTTTNIAAGDVLATLNVEDASVFPNEPGLITINFGRGEEGPIAYFSRPNNNTLLIDASKVFDKSHTTGSTVNLTKAGALVPRVTGLDYAFYVTDPTQARLAAQNIIRRLIASGVVIRFIVDFVEYQFECVCRDCGPEDSVGLSGSRTGSGPLTF